LEKLKDERISLTQKMLALVKQRDLYKALVSAENKFPSQQEPTEQKVRRIIRS
jgi:predicted TPR repeat methyltransferase